jgi:ribosomal protein L44E
VGKTYRKTTTEKIRKKKQQKWKNFNIKRRIRRELEDYENQEKVSTLSDDYLSANS